MQKALETLIVKQAVAEVVQRWGRARDQGLWDDLAATFHPGGTIKVMWFEGRHEDFIAACAKRFTPGVGSTKHFFGMPVVEVNGARALSETAAQISMSGTIADAQFISQSFVRFLDRFEPRNGDPFTDPAFQNAIDAVSAKGQVRFGAEHLYYELARRQRPKTGCAVSALIFFSIITLDRKSTRLNSSHIPLSRMPSSA